MQKIVLYLIRGYRLLVSPFMGTNCRFYPSCSHYAETAVHRHGILKGSWLAMKRLGRCHPWHAGGVDEVPELKEK
jgi:putative membrane protein insertion efficiency factor